MKEIIFDPIAVIKRFNEEPIEYLLIGRQAVIQYGAPLVSNDFDFWIHPKFKKLTYKILTEEFEFEASHGINKPAPIVHFYAGFFYKIDIFFFKSISNTKKETVDFETSYKKALIKEDPDTNFSVTIPNINDLIKLKTTDRAKDKIDIEYLSKIKNS